MTPDSKNIRKAVLEDVDQIMDIISGTIEEMHSYGSTQWSEQYPQRKNFENDIAEQTLYVYEVEKGKVLGFICLNFIEPPEYKELKWCSDKKAIVIHRMSVSIHAR